MARLHLSLQGKGGVGKSLVASVIAQHRILHGYELVCIDTDPINATLSAYQDLNVKHLQLLRDNDIDARQFDELIETVLTAAPDAEVVVDTGATSFVQFCSYMLEHQALHVLAEAGHEIIVHCVLTGGQAMVDTLAGLESLVEHFHGPARVVVWLNEYYGPVESVKDSKTTSILDMEIYRRFEPRIDGVITIWERSHLFSEDMKELLERRQTFAAAQRDSSLTVMTKHRLQTIWNSLVEQLDIVIGAPVDAD